MAGDRQVIKSYKHRSRISIFCVTSVWNHTPRYQPSTLLVATIIASLSSESDLAPEKCLPVLNFKSKQYQQFFGRQTSQMSSPMIKTSTKKIKKYNEKNHKRRRDVNGFRQDIFPEKAKGFNLNMDPSKRGDSELGSHHFWWPNPLLPSSGVKKSLPKRIYTGVTTHIWEGSNLESGIVISGICPWTCIVRVGNDDNNCHHHHHHHHHPRLFFLVIVFLSWLFMIPTKTPRWLQGQQGGHDSLAEDLQGVGWWGSLGDTVDGSEIRWSPVDILYQVGHVTLVKTVVKSYN